MLFSIKQESIHRCRELRKKQTKAEQIFWQAVRDRRFCNLKFSRQYPIHFIWNDKRKFFVADFYCDRLKLVIEIDGMVHLSQKDKDKIRSFIINTLGLRVIRIQNEAVLKNIDGVMVRLREVL